MQWDHQYSSDRVDINLLSVCCRWCFHWWPWRGSRMLGLTTLAIRWMNMLRFSRIKMSSSGVEDWKYESADGQLSCCKWVKRQIILLFSILRAIIWGLALFLPYILMFKQKENLGPRCYLEEICKQMFMKEWVFLLKPKQSISLNLLINKIGYA